MALIPRASTSTISTNSDSSSSDEKRPPKIILTEEEYVSKIDQIIERDFFPDMERLRLRSEYQEALDHNDLERLRNVQERWGKLIAEETLNETNEDSSKSKVSEGLDEFLSNYTSEDNISFEQIVQETRAKMRQKYWWLFQAQSDANDASALPFDEAQVQAIASKESSLMLMNVWKYTPKNALMYNPDSAALTPVEMAELNKGKPVINHANTRMNRDHSKKIELLSRAMSTARSRINTGSGKVGVDGRVEESQSNQYSLVSTPTPAPGVGESPLMTWGEIGATPLPLDTPGPSFRIPETPAREELLFKLDSDNINKRKEANNLKQGVSKARGEKTPLTTYQRLKLLSPAAKRLACISGLATPSPLRISNTPRMTPSVSPFTEGNSYTPLMKKGKRADSTPSLTDNLLKYVNK